MRLLCLLLILWLPAVHCSSAFSVFDYDIKHWTSSDGLSSNSVRAVTQDQQGYLWFGTLYGLQRFDGEQFDLFTTERYSQLASNTITRLFTDSQGQIWIGTKAGLSVFNPQSWQFQRLPLFNEVTSIIEVSPGEIWVAADQLFQVKQGQVQRVESIKATVSQLAIYEQDIWIAGAAELYQGTQAGNWHAFPLPAQLKQTPVYHLSVNPRGVFLAAESGLFQLEEGEVNAIPLPDQTLAPVYQYVVDQRGASWISAYRKLFYQYPGQDWQIVTINELGLSPWFSQLFEDHQQQLWLTSISDGVLRASMSQIRRIIPDSDPVIRSIGLTPQGQLLIASQSELGLLSKQGHYSSLLDAAYFQNQTVHTLYWPSEQSLWLGTEQGLFQLSEQQLEPVFAELQGQSVRVLQAAFTGGVWVGALQGLYRIEQGQLYHAALNRELESRHITSLAENARQLIIGTSRGLYRQQGNRLSRQGSGTALYNAYILASLLLPDDTLLVSTLDDGIFIHQPADGWQQLNSVNGLLHGPAVSFYYHQASGWIWVSTHKGIFRLTRASLAESRTQGFQLEEILSPFDRQMGSLSSRCCNGAGQSKVVYWQQQFWFPTLKGLVAVSEQPLVLAESSFSPQIKYIQAQRTYPVTPAQARLLVESVERNLQISYTALEFSRPEALAFRYRLLGFDTEWQPGGNSRLAVYTNLPPGQFEFQLQAKYRHQSWQDALTTQLELVIPRRFEETLLYRLLWVLLVISCFYGLFWLYRQNVLNKQEQLTRLVRQRTQELENTNQQLNELNEQLLSLTHRDSQTGLHNSRFLQEQLPKDIEHFQRNAQGNIPTEKVMALLILQPVIPAAASSADMTTISEPQLQYLSTLLIRETRGSDYVVRLEPECFLVVLRDIMPADVKPYCQRLLQQLHFGIEQIPQPMPVPLALTAGYALYPLPLLGGQLLNWQLSLELARFAAEQLLPATEPYQLATLEFSEQLDAFEFEEAANLEQQLQRLLGEGLIRLQ